MTPSEARSFRRWSPIPEPTRVNTRFVITRADPRVQLVPVPGVESRAPEAMVAFTIRDFGHELGPDRFNDQHAVIRAGHGPSPRPGMAGYNGPRRIRLRVPPEPWDPTPIVDGP